MSYSCLLDYSVAIKRLFSQLYHMFCLGIKEVENVVEFQTHIILDFFEHHNYDAPTQFWIYLARGTKYNIDTRSFNNTI